MHTRTKVIPVYLPLIDMPPVEYDTVLTSMLQIKNLTEATGQPFSLFTLDQQLYRYAEDNQWALPEIFPITTFMAETGLVEIMPSCIFWCSKNAYREDISMCMRAIRMVVEVVLESIITDPQVQCYDTLIATLEEKQINIKK